MQWLLTDWLNPYIGGEIQESYKPESYAQYLVFIWVDKKQFTLWSLTWGPAQDHQGLSRKEAEEAREEGLETRQNKFSFTELWPGWWGHLDWSGMGGRFLMEKWDKINFSSACCQFVFHCHHWYWLSNCQVTELVVWWFQSDPRGPRACDL